MKRLAGIDLNGWHDRAARNWTPGHDDEEPGGEPQLVDAGIDPVVIWQGPEAAHAVGGPQARYAPHGRGPGWGAIGASERRWPVREALAALADDTYPKSLEALAASVRAVCPAPDHVVAVVPDIADFDETRQDRLLRALRSAKVSHPYLLWRPVALCLAAIEDGLCTAPETRVATVVHAPEGLQVQNLVVKRARRGDVVAPERAAVGTTLAWAGGLSALMESSAASAQACHPELDPAVAAGSGIPGVHALGAEPEDEVVRLANGTWRLLTPPAPRDQLPALPDALAAHAGAADVVLVDTPLQGRLRATYLRAIEERLGPRVHACDPTDAARGALVAADRIARGLPHYFDFLPQISILVLEDGEPVFRALVPEGETVPANELYRTVDPPRFRWPKGRASLDVFVKKQDAAGIRRWTVEREPGPPQNVEVAVVLEQRPAQGLAHIEVRGDAWAALARNPIRLDWSRLEVDPRPEAQILEELRRPPPPYPDRVVFPTDPRMWQALPRSAGFAQLVARCDPQDLDDVEGVSDVLSQGVVFDPPNGDRVRPVDSDGNVPEGVDPAAFDALTAAVADDALGEARRARPASTNTRLKFLTWCFPRCPDAVQQELLIALERPDHPWRAPYMANTLLWQGAGRCVADTEKIRHVFDLILRLDIGQMRAYHRACAANLLSRRDISFTVLTRDELSELAGRAAHLVLQAKKDGYKVNFDYGLRLTGGLLRYRIVAPYAWLPDLDPAGRQLEDALQTVQKDMDQRLARSVDFRLRRKRRQVEELLKFLGGSGGDPDLLRSLEED